MLKLPSRADRPAADAAPRANACPDWDAALELYYPELCEYVVRFVGSADAAQDVVQDLFLHLWETRGPQDAIRLTKAYLYTAAHNRALKYLRRRRVAAGWIERASREEAPAAESPSELYLRRELEDMVERAVAELPTRCREIFLLRRRDHLSYEEIAMRAGVSLGTVKSHMWRAAMMLREKLAPYVVGTLSLIAHVNGDSVLH
jgi:RNA polymerase sigma-70 factor (ECF subfamily)